MVRLRKAALVALVSGIGFIGYESIDGLIGKAYAEEAKKPEPVVYYGDLKVFNKPACIEVNKIVKNHPAYKKIQEKKLKPTDAEYWLLTDELNDELQKTLKKVVNNKGYDLIVEKGSILMLTEVSSSDSPPKVDTKEFKGKIPDINELVIEEFYTKK